MRKHSYNYKPKTKLTLKKKISHFFRTLFEVFISLVILSVLVLMGGLAVNKLHVKLAQADELKNQLNTTEQKVQQKEQEKQTYKEKLEEYKKQIEDLNKKLESKTADPGLFNKLTLIKKYFSKEPLTAIATFMAESGLRVDAINYNCRYIGADGKPYSKSCNKGDEFTPIHWSTDCGIAQINVSGQSCPTHLFNVEENLKVAQAKYNSRGWQPWYSYTKGGYLKKLDQAKQYLAMVN